MKKIGSYTGTSPILHEVSEAYRGAEISRENGVGSPSSINKESVYERAHKEAAYPQNFKIYSELYDINGRLVFDKDDAYKKEYRIYKQIGDKIDYIVIRTVLKK